MFRQALEATYSALNFASRMPIQMMYTDWPRRIHGNYDRMEVA